MPNTDKSWQQWGQQDPYYSVVSHTKFTRTQLPEHINEFFASGENFIERSLIEAQTAFGDFPRKSALDFGCGVGRLALPLAKQFAHVTGIDISEGMLTEARNNAAKMSLSNIEFAKSDDAISSAPGPYDLVNTYVVLQHIPPQRGMIILSGLLKKVAPGGIAMIHFSIERRLPVLRSIAYLGKNFVPGIRQIANFLRGSDVNRPTMQMNEYNLVRVLEMFKTNGFEPVLSFLEDHSGVMTVRLISKKLP